MDFEFTPDEAQSTAEAVVAHLNKEATKVEVEVGVDPSMPFRPTITATESGRWIFVEAQRKPRYSTNIEKLVYWTLVGRINCEVFIAVPVEAQLSGRFLTKVRAHGVGLFIVHEDGTVEKHRDASNPALHVTPDPGLALGSRKRDVLDAVEKFNGGQRKNGLQDLIEIVEGETDLLLKRLVTKRWITSKTLEQVGTMDWSDQINVAASKSVHVSGREPVVDANLKDDLHSFRGARNLLNHKATTAPQRRKREQQFAERMMQGPRLTADLLRAKKLVV